MCAVLSGRSSFGHGLAVPGEDLCVVDGCADRGRRQRFRCPDLDLYRRAGGLEQAAQRGHPRPGLVELAFQPVKMPRAQGAPCPRVGGRQHPPALPGGHAERPEPAEHPRGPARAWRACSAGDPRPSDPRREFWGTQAIRAWPDREIIGDKVTTDPPATAGHYGEVIVHAVTDGEYDKTGLPDPFVLTYYFTVREDSIVRLIIIHNEPTPAWAQQ